MGQLAAPAGDLSVPWHAMPDDVIGGWCVMPTEEPPSGGGYQIADFISQEVAEHIAALHNTWLAQGEASPPA